MPVRITVLPTAQSVPHGRPLLPGPAAVIDALRATTTITAALHAGALWVEPALSVAAARRRARALPGALLAGERHGDRLPGFDLGNSPVDVLGAAGCGIVLTTTNGTRAATRLAVRIGRWPVYAAALINRAAVTRALVTAAQEAGTQAVTLVCSGQDGHPAAEDLLVAGAIADALPAAWQRDDLATVAAWAWQAAAVDPARFLALCPHGAYLLGKGYGQDMAACARLDGIDMVPALESGPDGAPPRFCPGP